MREDYDIAPRCYALELIEEQMVSPEAMLEMCLSYMSHDRVKDMLDMNELSPRFMEEEV